MIFRSPYPDVTVPEIPLTDMVFRHAGQFAEKPALINGVTGHAYSYRELIEAIHRVAAGLVRIGFRQGDVLAIYSTNLPEYAIAFHAACILGGVVTTMNPLHTNEELASQLNDSAAKYLLTAPELARVAMEAANRSQVREVIVFGQLQGTTDFESLLRSNEPLPQVRIDPRHDLAALPYSSGTTGLPKGVMLTHYNLVANLIQIEASAHIGIGETVVCVLPFFHIYGMAVILNQGLYRGATIVTLPRFQLEHLLKVIQQYRVTFGPFVPPILLALARDPVVKEYDLSSLKTIFCAAAPLGENVAQDCVNRLGCMLKQGYGMTEASPATHMTPDDPSWNKIRSVGPCVSNTEFKIVDTSTEEELGPSESGHVLIRGPQVMKGYLNCPDASSEAIDSHGWLRTGDIGYADDDGCLYIVDRLKELIKYKGYQVAPAELEAILLSHPNIADAAVIPEADEQAGEIPKAVVVIQREVTEEEIKAYVAERVAPYKKIRKVEFVERIPKSPSGKILRRLLRERSNSREHTKEHG